MIRHKSLLEIGDVNNFLEREHPQHVYTSASKYEEPGAPTMEEKEWTSSDLIFDLDADHLPNVDPETATYAEMLAACKVMLLRLIVFLEEDFGFEDMSIVFSGGRGYHIHVRDAHVQDLKSEERREIADYIHGLGVEYDPLTLDTAGHRTPAGSALGKGLEAFSLTGGWSTRVHAHVVEYVDELLSMSDEDAIEHLTELDGIAEKKATAALTAIKNSEFEIKAGITNPHNAVKAVIKALVDETLDAKFAEVDKPVTTDINRLIRLPGTLHGGTGLLVKPLTREELDDFDPMIDAVPPMFMEHEIKIRVVEPTVIEIGGEEREFEEGEYTVPESVGIYLMANLKAEKEQE